MKITEDTIVTGAQFREFYLKNWPKNFWVEGLPLEVEDDRGEYVLPDDAKHPLSFFGYGHCYEDTEDGRYKKDEMIPIHELYAEAMGQKPDQILSFRCPADKVEDLKRLATDLGVELV